MRYAPRPESGILAGNARVPFGANVFVRRDVFEDHGGYDEALWVLCGRAALGVDDGEFGARLQKRGEPIGYCQEAMVTHPVHHERCRLSKQLRLAWYFGWRDALVFLDVERPRVERYQLGLVVRWASRVAASLVRANRADAFRQALKAARSAGELACRLSSSYNKRAAMLGAGMATAVLAVGQRRETGGDRRLQMTGGAQPREEREMTPRNDLHIILLAAGMGTRLGGDTPKRLTPERGR